MSSCLILMYHVIDAPRSSIEAQWCCAPKAFAEQMQLLLDHGYQVISLDHAISSLTRHGLLPDKSVVITFDDGTRCFLENALPILQHYRIPATLFMVAGLQGRSNEWFRSPMDAALLERPLLSTSELRLLSTVPEVTIGSHSMTHADLSKLDSAQLDFEVRISKEVLQQSLGMAVDHFAYPFGSISEAAYSTARLAGYKSASTVIPGRNRFGQNPHLLKRIEVYNQDSLRDFRWKLRLANSDARFNRRTARSLARKLLTSLPISESALADH